MKRKKRGRKRKGRKKRKKEEQGEIVRREEYFSRKLKVTLKIC